MANKIYITPTLIAKMNVLSSEYNIEVGGYLTGEIKDGIVYLKDLLIPNQKISSVSVHISPQDQVELRKKFGDKVSKIIGHWHSHHSLGVGWSPTDYVNMRNIMEYKDIFIFVVSGLGQHLIKVIVKNPIRFELDDCDFYIKSLGIDLARKKVNNLIPLDDVKEENDLGDEIKEDES